MLSLFHAVHADTLRVGNALPDTMLQPLKGESVVKLNEITKGKKRVVHLFASW